MKNHDREVVELLREDPELLAIADAVVETQRLHRRKPLGALAAVAAAAAALFALVLASPWDDGSGGKASLLDRALAAIETGGPVVHMTIRLEAPPVLKRPPLITESYYDAQRGLVRVVSRRDGETLADYTTKASEDEFAPFPGLLEGAEYYRKALSSGRAYFAGQGTWRHRPVQWVRWEGIGRAGIIEAGIDRETYRPIVFRTVPPSGFQVDVLGFEYVSPEDAAFQPNASALATGVVLGRDCQPARARVGAYLGGTSTGPENELNAEVASARSGPDGRFTLRVDPRNAPFRGDGRFELILNVQVKDPTKAFAFVRFWRVAEGGKWLPTKPMTVTVGDNPFSRADCR